MDWLLIALTLIVLLCGVLIGAAGTLLVRRKRSQDTSVKPGGSLLDDQTLILVARATTDALWDLDLRTNELRWSEQLSHNFGYEEGDLQTVLDWWTERVHPDDRTHAEKSLQKAIELGQANWSAEYRFRRADGSYADVVDRGHTIYDKQGRAVRMIGAMVDVTDLRESEQRFAAFMNNNPAVAWIKDADGRYVFVNKTLCEEYQIAEENVLGRTDRDLLPGRVADVLRANDREVLRSKQPIQTLETISNPDGTDHVWLIDKFPLETQQGEMLVGGLALDVTDQKRNEQALREYATALERSNRDLEQFAYVASHDLQEPLRMVSSYTQLLATRYRGRLDADADEFIHFAVDGAMRMQRLIQDLLAYSRVSSRGNKLTLFDADEALDIALRNLSRAVQESGAIIQREPLPRVNADSGQLVQLFQNLLSNAIKFHGETPPCVQVSAEQRDNEWVISIRDNCIGIDPEYQEQIFVIFRRLHNREKYAGTGIGLALCKRIVERHGGRIWVESAAGQGSTFRFTIPAAEETSP